MNNGVKEILPIIHQIHIIKSIINMKWNSMNGYQIQWYSEKIREIRNKPYLNGQLYNIGKQFSVNKINILQYIRISSKNWCGSSLQYPWLWNTRNWWSLDYSQKIELPSGLCYKNETRNNLNEQSHFPVIRDYFWIEDGLNQKIYEDWQAGGGSASTSWQLK